MRLLLINDYGLQGGGTENRVRLLVNEFLKNNYFERIHILQVKGTEPVNKDAGVSFYYSSGKLKESYHVVKDIIRKEQIDIIQAHNMLALTPAGIKAAKELNVPVVWFAHDYWPLCAKRTFIDPYEAEKKESCQKAGFMHCLRCVGIRTCLRLKLFRYLLREVDLAVAASNFVKDIYESHGLLKGKWQVVSPWIDVDIFLSTASYTNRNNCIVFTGPLVDYKGAWVMAKAFKDVLREIPDARLKFIGGQQESNNVYRKKLERIFAEDGVSCHVDFLGHKDWHSLKQLYQNTGVYVCPPVWRETFGLNWAEAMAAGCPVIASSIGSLPELLEGKAILTPPRDHRKLAENIIFLLKNKDVSDNLNRKGIKYINETFRVERAAEAIIKIYKQYIYNCN